MDAALEHGLDSDHADLCGDSTHTAERIVATSVPDPPKCIAACRQQFLDAAIHKYDETSFNTVCEAFSNNVTKEGDKRLWGLYCCDSVYCGVWIDHKDSKLGQDRELICGRDSWTKA
jgi:hypothetical protein